jgi:hypothetical protein
MFSNLGPIRSFTMTRLFLLAMAGFVTLALLADCTTFGRISWRKWRRIEGQGDRVCGAGDETRGGT